MTSWMKSQGAKQPTAYGSLLQSSAYGSAIPIIYGQTQSPLLAIWAANLRQGGSGKKKKALLKGAPTYVENVDFLLGHNPIMAVLQVWNNGSLLPLNFLLNQSQNSGSANTGIVIAPIVPLSGGGTGPDPAFYCLIAITAPQPYSFTFDDYGSQGLQTITGDWEVPFWNELEQGPDPTHPSTFRFTPYCYRWEPSYGPFIYIDTQFGYGANINIYYAQINFAASSPPGNPPLTRLRLAFESQLGSGTEYADAGLSAQQIIYPHFAGCGSSDIDLGASGALPQLIPEVRGKWGVYPSGDADFADIIEDIFKSGLAQASLQAEETPTFTTMERGLSSYQMPGCIQRKVVENFDGVGPIPYNLPTTAENFLVVLASEGNTSTATMSISDTGGNTWTPLLPAGHSCQIWYAKALGGPTVVTTGPTQQMTMLEIGGVDTYDSVSVTTGVGVTNLTTTTEPGFAGYVLGIATNYAGGGPFDPHLANWNPVVTNYNGNPNLPGHSTTSGFQLVLDRVLRSPATLAIPALAGVPAYTVILAFKSSQPSNFPTPLGDFIDFPSLDQVRYQCRAYSLWGSLSLNSQSAASDVLKSLYFAANAAPVYLGSKLFSYPYAEQSFAGNGSYFTSPTNPGPVANLNADNGDFVGDDGCPKLQTVDRIGLPNVLQLQCFDRNANYNQIVVQQPDAASIALYGERKADPIVCNAIQDPSIARALLGIQVRRNQYGGDRWNFTASARSMLLSPMDLITLTDSLQSIFGVPVRITSYVEQEDGSFLGQAEPFVYGMCSPTALPTTSPEVNPLQTNVSAGDVNPPIIFEPTPPLYPSLTGDQLWVVVSSESPNYGGCQVMVSTDGGASYSLAGPPMFGNAVTGFLTAPWPAANDPDTTNNLFVDLTESNGVLPMLSTTAENNFEYPCYVQSTGSSEEVNGVVIANGDPMTEEINGTAIATLNTEQVNGTSIAASTASDGFGYELMAYAVATLTGTNKFELMATGVGNELRRSIQLAPSSSGVGVGHAPGARFALISPAGTGILKLPMPILYVGQTIFFKILSFNQFGTALQALADVTAYSYVPTGVPGAA